jgi:hypothetical protein
VGLDVELGDIEVHEGRTGHRQLVPGAGEALGKVRRAVVAGSAQHGGGEPRLAVPGRSDGHGAHPGGSRGLEEGRHALPRRGVEVVEPGQLIHDPVAAGVENPVADHAVLPGRGARGQGRQRRRRRRREHRRDRRVGTEPGCERASVPAMRFEGGAAEAVGDQHDGVGDRCEAQATGPPRKRIEAIRQDIGQAEPMGFHRR